MSCLYELSAEDSRSVEPSPQGFCQRDEQVTGVARDFLWASDHRDGSAKDITGQSSQYCSFAVLVHGEK